MPSETVAPEAAPKPAPIDNTDGDAAAVDEAVPPRKVQTVIVRPDGTIVAAEDVRPANPPADQAAGVPDQGSGAGGSGVALASQNSDKAIADLPKMLEEFGAPDMDTQYQIITRDPPQIAAVETGAPPLPAPPSAAAPIDEVPAPSAPLPVPTGTTPGSLQEAKPPPQSSSSSGNAPAKPVRDGAPVQPVVARHPTVDAPDQVLVGETITVAVALTEDQQTPEATARAAPGTSLSEDGALTLALPAETDAWPIDIDLFAPGFDLAGGGAWGQRVELLRDGDSDVARFEIKARKIAQDHLDRRFTVRFYHQGKFLGSATRPVKVLREQPTDTASQAAGLLAAPALIEKELQTELLIGKRVEVADLDVTILYDDPAELGPARISIHSPHLGAPLQGTFTTPEDMPAWLDQEYRQLVKLGLDIRSAKSLNAPPTGSAKDIARFAAQGFGDALYRNYVPEAFKSEFWKLKAQGKLKSIQITSNSTMFPWELVRPISADGATKEDFLGLSYRLARWAPRTMASQTDSPLDTMAFTGVAAIAPAYADNLSLPFQQSEIAALSKLAGFKQFGGDFLSFQKLLGEVSGGFVHFSGHGEVNAPGGGLPTFAIRLLDASMDPSMWSALNLSIRRQGRPFYFFNACDTGKSDALGGFVQGWGPAVLESGASGFIGGMWPLTDRSAADFSTGFYGEIAEGLPRGPVYLADVLRDVRRRFYENGDPTYLAYTFYGNANLQVTAK